MLFILPIILLFILIACNGFFVASEISLVRVRKTRIEILVKKNNKKALLVQKALQNPSKFFSATQLGITLSSLALGSLGEPIAAEGVNKLLFFLPVQISTVWSHAITIGLGFILITFFQIIFGELIPKNIAIQRSEKIALTNIGLLLLFLSIFRPIIDFLSFIANSIVKLIKIRQSNKPNVSKEEIKLILSQSAQSGVLNSQEISLIKKVFHISETPVTDIMTPNNSIIAVNELSTIKEAINSSDTEYVHSRIPVYQYSINNIIGFIHVVDLHRAILNGNSNKSIVSLNILRNIIVIDARARVDDVIKIMKHQNSHLAVIKDQKQKTIGIVTIEDIVRQFS